jgi:hypothetical protein
MPLVEKIYKKKQKNKNLIPTSAKRQNRGKFAVFYVCCWILAGTVFVVHHL